MRITSDSKDERLELLTMNFAVRVLADWYDPCDVRPEA